MNHNPALAASAIVFYFLSSSSTSLYHKWLYDYSFQGIGFHFPIFVVFCQTISAYLLTHVIVRTKPSWNIPVTIDELKYKLLPIALCVITDILLTNEAVANLDLSFVMMVKCSSPVFVLLFSQIFIPEHSHDLTFLLLANVVMVCGGTAVVVWGEHEHVGSGYGWMLALVTAICAGLKSVLSQMLLHGQIGIIRPLSPLVVLRHLTLISSFLLLPPLFAFEFRALLAWVSAASSFTVTVTPLLFISVGSALAFSLNFTEYLIISLTSALSMSIAGICKTVLVVLLSCLFFGDTLAGVNLIGFAVCLCGLVGYNVIKYHTWTHSPSVEKFRENRVGGIESGEHERKPLLGKSGEHKEMSLSA